MSKASIMLWPVSRGSLGREFHSLGPSTERRNENWCLRYNINKISIQYR